MVAIAHRATDDQLMWLGCGPLMSFLIFFGDEYWPEIEAEARRDRRMAQALRHAWCPGTAISASLDSLLEDLGVTT
jgi:hypothetical protein